MPPPHRNDAHALVAPGLRPVGLGHGPSGVQVGESGDRLTRAAKVLEQLSGQQPVFSRARYTVRSFGIRRNEKIACHVTMRGEKVRASLPLAPARRGSEGGGGGTEGEASGARRVATASASPRRRPCLLATGGGLARHPGRGTWALVGMGLAPSQGGWGTRGHG